MLFSLGAAYLAGVLAILSPCILPIAPIVIVSAWQQNRFGPLALVLGLSTTFTVLGLTLAVTGTVLGFSAETLPHAFGILLILLGVIFFFPRLEAAWSHFITPLAMRFHAASHRVGLYGLGGQFLIGALLGGAWLPCIGPTLGLALSLAQQGHHLGQAGLIMILYSLGASTPLLLIGYAFRPTLERKKIWTSFASKAKKLLGGTMILMGFLILTGWMVYLETWLLLHAPHWLIALTAKF